MNDLPRQHACYRPKLLRVPLNWAVLLKKMSLDVEEVASLSKLPVSIFKQGNSKITHEQFIDIWRVVERLHNKEYMGLTFARKSLKEVVNLSFFALLFSKDMTDAITKLNDFQPLMLPIYLTCEDEGEESTIRVNLEFPIQKAPKSFSYAVLVFLIELIRTCTGERIIPSRVQLNNDGEKKERYIDYFGVIPENANYLSLTIKRSEMKKTFLSSNDKLSEYFGPLLNKKKSLLVNNSSRYSGKIKAYLYENLANGQNNIEVVSEYFSITSRTLQRRLSEEGISFRRILDETRSEMAFIYLSNTNLAAYEISFLLGFEDKNSFFRAFHRWTGTTPQSTRASLEERKIFSH